MKIKLGRPASKNIALLSMLLVTGAVQAEPIIRQAKTEQAKVKKKVVKVFTVNGEQSTNHAGQSNPITPVSNSNVSNTKIALPEKQIVSSTQSINKNKVSTVLAPLVATGDIANSTKESVSPFGQLLARSFSWIDDLVGIKPVKPWQKSTLAEPVMNNGGVLPEHAKLTKKVFLSKEASSGGDGVAGGGCGCK